MNSRKQYMIRDTVTQQILKNRIFDDKGMALNWIKKHKLENFELLCRTVSYTDWKPIKDYTPEKEPISLQFTIFEKIVGDNIAEVSEMIKAVSPLSEKDQILIKSTWNINEYTRRYCIKEDKSPLANEYHYYYKNGYVRQIKVSKKELEFDYIVDDTIIDTSTLFKLTQKLNIQNLAEKNLSYKGLNDNKMYKYI